MKYKERQEFNKDCEEIYRATVKPLYLKWRQYSNGEVNEMFFFWIARHHHEKIMALCNKRKHRKLKVAVLKSKLEAYEFEEKQEQFMESLNEEKKVQ